MQIRPSLSRACPRRRHLSHRPTRLPRYPHQSPATLRHHHHRRLLHHLRHRHHHPHRLLRTDRRHPPRRLHRRRRLHRHRQHLLYHQHRRSRHLPRARHPHPFQAHHRRRRAAPYLTNRSLSTTSAPVVTTTASQDLPSLARDPALSEPSPTKRAISIIFRRAGIPTRRSGVSHHSLPA